MGCKSDNFPFPYRSIQCLHLKNCLTGIVLTNVYTVPYKLATNRKSKVSEYDLEILQSHTADQPTADQPTASRERAPEH